MHTSTPGAAPYAVSKRAHRKVGLFGFQLRRSQRCSGNPLRDGLRSACSPTSRRELDSSVSRVFCGSSLAPRWAAKRPWQSQTGTAKPPSHKRQKALSGGSLLQALPPQACQRQCAWYRFTTTTVAADAAGADSQRFGSLVERHPVPQAPANENSGVFIRCVLGKRVQ